MAKDKNLQINNSLEFEFYKNYAEKVAPVLEEFEKERKIILKRTVLISAVLIALAVLLVGVGVPLYIRGDWKNHYILWCFICFILPVLSLVSICLFIAAVVVICDANEDFRTMLKRKCSNKLLDIFENIKRSNNKKITDEEIDESGLFDDYTHRTDDDWFHGYYKDVEFFITETTLQYIGGETEEERNKEVYDRKTIFNGVLITFSSNKKIKKRTMVLPKRNRWGMLKCFLPLVFIPLTGLSWVICATYPEPTSSEAARLFYIFAPFIFMFCGVISVPFCRYSAYKNQNTKGLDKISLEDPEFNRKYNVYSSDQVEGRYLLTTAFMERFKNLHTAFGSNRAKCSFYDGDKLMFAISTNKNLFEIGNLFAPINNTKQINVFLKEIQTVYDMIDYFKLDENTGL